MKPDFLLSAGKTWDYIRKEAEAIFNYFYELHDLWHDFMELIHRDYIDNGVDNYQIGETAGLTPRFTGQSFVCPVPMDNTVTRRHFPCIYRFGDYSMMIYLAGSTHSINALLPHKLEFARSRDLWKTCEVIEPKVVKSGTTMRAINPSIDGFFVNQAAMCQTPDDKIWIYFCTFNFTVNPPALATQWQGGKSWLVYSQDYGTTWSEMIEIDNLSYVPSSSPIVVGNEIWVTGYGYHTGSTVAITDLHSYLLKYNYVTNSVVGKYQIDAAWTGLSTTEPVIYEHTTGNYICAARVNHNANFVGNELENKGMVIAYSTDGEDWTDYTFDNWGTNYPNQPRIFKHKKHLYLSFNGYTAHGKLADKISWIVKSPSLPDFYKYGYFFRLFLGALQGSIQGIDRYDPRTEYNTELVKLQRDGSIDFCVYDDTKEIILAAVGFRQSGSGSGYLGEPWVAIIKRNSLKSDGTKTQRQIFMTEIPGDSHTSNSIKVYNDFVAADSDVSARWVDDSAVSLTVTCENKNIIFTAGAKVNNAKIIYEIL